MIPSSTLVIGRLVALNSRVLHQALTWATRGCTRGQGQGNSSPAVVSGWSSPGGLAGIPKLPYLLLFSRGQLGPFGIGILSVHNVGLLVNFRLGNKSHLASVRGLGPLAPVRSTWDTPAPVPTAGNRGYLPGLWVIGRVLSALELNVSVFHRVKVSKIGTVGID
jgi:hypothetical protein